MTAGEYLNVAHMLSVTPEQALRTEMAFDQAGDCAMAKTLYCEALHDPNHVEAPGPPLLRAVRVCMRRASGRISPSIPEL